MPAFTSEELQYCPFFNNRGASHQPFLKNCTWYSDNACCTQTEIDYAFAAVKPPQGASPACLKQLNYLMCYICDPLQYQFYKNEYLTVNLTFCNNLYNACKDAILKGSVIRELYDNGEDFCLSRRFRVSKIGDDDGDTEGFFYNNELDANRSPVMHFNYLVCLISLMLVMIST